MDEVLADGEKRSQRSIHRMDDSTLSRRLSQIPKERAATVLSSSAEGSRSPTADGAGHLAGGNQPPAPVGNLISVLNMQNKGSFGSDGSGAASSSPTRVLQQNNNGRSSSRRNSNSSQKSTRSPLKAPAGAQTLGSPRKPNLQS